MSRALAVLLLAALLLAACARAPQAPAAPGVDLSDPNVGGGAGEAAGPQTPVPTASPTREGSPRLDGTATMALPAQPTADRRPPTAAPTIDDGPQTTASATADGRPPTAAPTTDDGPQTTAQPTADRRPPTAAPTSDDRPQTTPTAETTSAPEATPTTTATPGGERVHIVQAGENLYRIGLLYGLSWVAIAEYNGIVDPNAITVGQELRIPPGPTATPEGQTSGPTTDGRRPTAAEDKAGGQVPGGEASFPAPDLWPLEPSPPAVGGQPSAVVVAVAAGDTLYGISRQYGVDWAQIAEANGLATPNQLYPGQLLKIPPDVPGPAPEFSHRVHSGETLARLAQQYGLSAAELAEANGLSAPYTIYSGQTLIIPSDE